MYDLDFCSIFIFSYVIFLIQYVEKLLGNKPDSE